jgi:altronate hydrolase
MGEYDPERFRTLVTQQVEDEHEAGMALIQELVARMKKDVRTACPASELVVGLKCGGSDGLSGITANPTIGVFSDMLTAMGGSTILTEVPEMFGAETILMSRCPTEELFEKTVSLINNFKRYYQENHQTIYENPSPGNKAGGISSLEDKALGCTQKSGFSPVRGVLAYGERVVNPGLNLLSAPGNDLVAATGLAASGANLVLFTTGRGTPFASPVPTLKIATNPRLAEFKSDWIDFAAGDLLKGKTLDELADALLDLVMEVASGKEVVSEARGFHDLAIFKTGVTL